MSLGNYPALVVSIPKSGTHLLSKLIQILGYDVYGWVNKRCPPSLSEAEVTAWGLRLCFPEWREYEFMLPASIREKLDDHRLASVTSLPASVAFFTHDFGLKNIDHWFLNGWAANKVPRIIFLYRDPRQQLLSLIRFYTSRDPHKAKLACGVSEGAAWREILCSLDTDDARIKVALQNPAFGQFSLDMYEKNAWLLHHPDVIKIKYEDLVGSAGGGNDDSQKNAVDAVLSHLGVEPEKGVPLHLLYGGTATFAEGKSSTWQDVYSPESIHMINETYAKVLDLYGYER